MTKTAQGLRYVAAAIMALALIGLTDTGYLTAHKIFGTPLQCGVSGSCETVANSPYSLVFGVPLSLIGMIFYLTMFFGALIYREFGLTKVLKGVAALSIASVLTSAYLVSVQLFIIHAICIYCMISAGLSVGLLALGIAVLLTLKKLTPQISAPSPLPAATDSE